METAVVDSNSVATDVTSQPVGAVSVTSDPEPAKYDVIVIGGGPAGLMACIYLARKNLKVLIVTKDIGGQTAWSSDVENYLGFTTITGAELTRHFQDHLSAFSENVTLKLSNDGVKRIVKTGSSFAVELGDGSNLTSKAVIIASGKSPRQLGIVGEQEFLHRGVTYCAWCDGPLFKNKSVAIIGGGNSALDAALSVETIANQIYIINNGPELTGDEVMIEKARASHKIRIINNANIVAISGDKFVSSVTYLTANSQSENHLPVEGVMIEVGSVPADDYVQGLVDLNDLHEIVIDKRNMTSVDGIFAAGDVTDVSEKQIVIAAGEGAKAAIQCSKWLASRP